MSKDKTLAALMRKYITAEVNLSCYLNDLFPPGCTVKCRLTGNEYTVKEGSLYPDQVLTNLGHISPTHLERKNVNQADNSEG